MSVPGQHVHETGHVFGSPAHSTFRAMESPQGVQIAITHVTHVLAGGLIHVSHSDTEPNINVIDTLQQRSCPEVNIRAFPHSKFLRRLGILLSAFERERSMFAPANSPLGRIVSTT
jgi:hypothetical protein